MKAVYDGTNFIDKKGLIITEDNYKDITELEVLGRVEEIENYAFEDLANLKYCKIDEGVEIIGYGAFCNLENLEQIDLPEGLDFIKHGAFSCCYSLKKLVIPNTVSEVDKIMNESNLDEIIVSKDNKFYDSRNNCNAIIDSRTNILETGCKNTIIPEDVEGIEDYSFEACIGLKSIVFPESVKWVGNFAFAHCDDLESVYIHKTFKEAGADVFPENRNFTIYYEGSKEEWKEIDFYQKKKYKVVFNYKF